MPRSETLSFFLWFSPAGRASMARFKEGGALHYVWGPVTLALNVSLCAGMEAGHAVRPVRDPDDHSGRHLLEHEEKGGLADGENARQRLHRVCAGKTDRTGGLVRA